MMQKLYFFNLSGYNPFGKHFFTNCDYFFNIITFVSLVNNSIILRVMDNHLKIIKYIHTIQSLVFSYYE